MMTQDLDSAIDASHKALDAILRGDPSVYEALFSDSDDVTLGNPFGPYAHGRTRVEQTLAGAASNYRDGEAGDRTRCEVRRRRSRVHRRRRARPSQSGR